MEPNSLSVDCEEIVVCVDCYRLAMELLPAWPVFMLSPTIDFPCRTSLASLGHLWKYWGTLVMGISMLVFSGDQE